MKIVCDQFWLDLQDFFEVLDSFFEEFVAFEIFQITNVLTEEGVLTLRQADCVLQFSADGENGRDFVAQKHRHGNKPARASELLRASLLLHGRGRPCLRDLESKSSHHRVVAAQQNFAIVNEEQICKAAETYASFFIGDRSWLFTQ